MRRQTSTVGEEPSLHPKLASIAWLVGTWGGEGQGFYPTIQSFGYGEETRFWHSGKPLLSYRQRTWSLDDGSPLHSEAGFWRPQEDGSIELVLAHGFGVAEVSEGRIGGRRIDVVSRSLAHTSTANRVDEVHRVLVLEGEELRYEIEMAAADQPLQGHLRARLRRS
jgi:THAP4-like, heme-binding beta-barrel domain